MIRTVSPQPTLWESVIPQCLIGLPGDLAEIDALLDDERFFEPFRPFFDPTIGRPSVPLETYIRMMFLKYRHKIGFEPLCREVADSLAWRRFCHIPLAEAVPHPTTLMKITTHCGEDAAAGLNEALLAKTAEKKVVKLDKARADNDSRRGQRRLPDRFGPAGQGRGQAREAERGRQSGRPGGTDEHPGPHPFGASSGACHRRVASPVPDGSTRVVTLHDPDARPIAKGRLGRPVEFGFKAQVVDNADGVVLDHHVVKGNPPDAPMLVPAIARIAARFGRAPKSVTADRGYGEAAVDAGLEAIGVGKVVIPRRGKPGAARQEVQRARGFQKLVKWRTGSEARISCLKRDYGWRRTRIDGTAGAQRWCAWGVLAHNATKISGVINSADAPEPPRAATSAISAPPDCRGTGPPGRQRAAPAA